LPIQAESVLNFGLLENKSAIINGPGTSGKTFCGEMAAIFHAASRRKAIFVVPHKAIAEEKYNYFEKLYGTMGLKVRISSRDHTSHDIDIKNNRFDILVTIYEKLNALTSDNLNLIDSCHCFVLDEFQLIADQKRGFDVELLIAKIKKFGLSKQLIILMGGGLTAGNISDWLTTPLLEDSRRPVELRLGTYYKGSFHFRGFNDRAEGQEQWLEKRDGRKSENDINDTFEAIKYLLDKGEQVLVFVSSKEETKQAAIYLAENLELKCPNNILSVIDEFPPSLQNEQLASCLKQGTAFHHADLDPDQRYIVENAFRNGELNLLVSTTTLAWGVNLPAKNVFVNGMKYVNSDWSGGKMILSPLSSIDFHQAAGRAGRFNQREKYGRAIMKASSELENEIIWQTYIQSSDSEIESGFKTDRLGEMVLKLVSCGAGMSRGEISDLTRGLFKSSRDEVLDLQDNTDHVISELLSHGLIREKFNASLIATDLGKIGSASGLSIDSILAIAGEIESRRLDKSLEWLCYCFSLDEWHEMSGSYPSKLQYCIYNEFVANSDIQRQMTESEYISNFLIDPGNPAGRKIINAFLFAIEWSSGAPTTNLEYRYNRGVGGLRRDAHTLVWILSTIEKILHLFIRNCPEYSMVIDNLSRLRRKLKYGVEEEMLFIVEIFNIDREFARMLYDFGIKSPEYLVGLDYSTLSTILPESVATTIYKKLSMIRAENNSKLQTKEFIADDSVIFTGRKVKALKEGIIFDKSILLQPRLYTYFQKLWRGYLSENPWVLKEQLGPGENQAKYISKIRRILKNAEIDMKIVSDSDGSYRLMLPERVNSAVVAGENNNVAVNDG